MVVVALPRVPVPRLKFVLNKLVLVAVPKYPIPLAVMLVVLAPPDIVKSPDVMVEDALERKPLPKVARSALILMIMAKKDKNAKLQKLNWKKGRRNRKNQP